MSCPDVVENSNVESVLHAESNHDHTPSTDNCSPFCVCHCCHTHVTTNNHYYEGIIFQQVFIWKSPYTDAIDEGFPDSSFHPPIA